MPFLTILKLSLPSPSSYKNTLRTTLVAQGLSLLLSMQGVAGSIPGQETKIPHALSPKHQNTKQKYCCNRFNKDFKKWSTSKKKQNRCAEAESTSTAAGDFGAMSHTILLVQPTKSPEGRTYADYESVNECMEGVCKMYEEHMKRMNPNSPSITYDISQLLDFIDDLADLSCLVYRADTQTYQPYNKDWIKEKIYVLLHRQAQQAGK